jgi:hypothetical protein
VLASPSTFSLLLWPSLLTLALSVGRLIGEVKGIVPPTSGGALHPLGIGWCVFLFGAWYGWRLLRDGSAPRVRCAWLWALVALLAFFGTVAWQFRPFVGGPADDATFERLRIAVLVIVAVALAAGAAMFAVWPRLASLMLLYALGARLTVVALTIAAEHFGWVTHYTKFGPSGIERGMADTIVAASVAQLGGWVPFTIVGGVLAGGIVAGCRRGPVRTGPGALRPAA